MNKWVSSQFNNICCLEDGSVRLYNSFVGSASLVIVRPPKKEKIINWLKNNDIDENADEFPILKERGFFVEAGTDEKLKVEAAYNELVFREDLMLVILPTEMCNFMCGYCYEDFKRGEMSYELRKGIVQFVRKNITRYKKLQVGWFGGEPTMAMDTVRYLSKEFKEICKAAKKTYSGSMTTNGYNLTLDLFEELIEMGIYEYQVTLDGPKDIHDNLRPHKNGKGSFDVIIKNLLEIKNNIKCRFFRICIRTNFSRNFPKDRIKEFISFLYEKFGEDDRFRFSIHFVSDWGGERVNKINEKVVNDRKDFEDIFHAILNCNVRLDYSYHLMDFDAKGVCSANCKNQFVIGSEGLIYKCTADFGDDHVIGRISETGEMIINKQKHLPWITSGWREKSECKECSFNGCCMSSTCPEHYIFKNNVKKNCKRTKTYLKEYLQLFDEKYFEIIE